MNKHLRVVSKERMALAEGGEKGVDLVLKLLFAAQILQALDAWVNRKDENG